MARTKSTKVNKVSYAERVLGALTQVQKEHRKSSVHMATLRAQIKRNAEARDDHLGPQWSHWVTKAVHKLMEEGVISMNEQAIFLTAEGKNTMSVAKKSVRHLNDAEDLVIRNAVILATPSSSLSKRRRSVFSAAGLPLDDDVSASAAPPPRKRARKSNTTNTASRMTTGATATSITPVRRGRPPRKSTLATVTNAPASRDASPLTDVEDLDAEENERLRRELRGKDHEILTLKTRLHDAISARPPAFNLRARGYDSDEDAHGEEDGGDAQAQGQPMIHVT
ncbi:hypothetical protein BKA70DRAFT_394743 [Coprinopsis sp. MPI-PUGE-AT-0042]|nr:hypothetical protein BKA70DRAFT_394743 [Coprinopsis sp. MPI-PUGE-AT-0042]